MIAKYWFPPEGHVSYAVEAVGDITHAFLVSYTEEGDYNLQYLIQEVGMRLAALKWLEATSMGAVDIASGRGV